MGSLVYFRAHFHASLNKLNADFRWHIIYTLMSLRGVCSSLQQQTLRISANTGKLQWKLAPPPPSHLESVCMHVCVYAITEGGSIKKKKESLSSTSLSSGDCTPPVVQLGFRYLKSNLSSSGHQTIPKCQWWISLWVALTIRGTFWCSRILSSPFYSLMREGESERERKRWEEEGQFMVRPRWDPIWTDPHILPTLTPSGSGRSPLISRHQRVPAHQRTPCGLPAQWVPGLITDKKTRKQGATQSFSHPLVRCAE